MDFWALVDTNPLHDNYWSYIVFLNVILFYWLTDSFPCYLILDILTENDT